MRPRSTKTAARDRRYKREREAFLAEHPWCQARLADCTIVATEVHHMAGRSPSVFFDQSRWLAVCHADHVEITEHPAMAFEAGLSVHRNGAA